MNYILGIDQSTQGTKAILFDEKGKLIQRADHPHRQIVNDQGWVEHDPEELYANVIHVVKDVVAKAEIDPAAIAAVGISNQRETTLVWDKTGVPLYNAIVWQDARAAELCNSLGHNGFAAVVAEKTGIRLSPYFPGGKLLWLLQNVESVAKMMRKGELRLGTVDTWLIYRLTGGKVYRTDYSNASRTQLMNLRALSWDEELCEAFGIDPCLLPEITDSDGDYGETNFEGLLPRPVPIRAVLGDFHAALFGQGCTKPGMVKATYGTGSSVMMNVGDLPIFSRAGVVTSLAWKLNGQVSYVLEGNINYAGAVITWLKDDLGLIRSAGETEALARQASPEDHTVLVPAFSGLGAPYWDSNAAAAFSGMTRTKRKPELVRAALDSIAFQITDILTAMETDTGIGISALRADGGPTANGYLMQFQSDMARFPVEVSPVQELSAMGAAYAAGTSLGMYDPKVLFAGIERTAYLPQMDAQAAAKKYARWAQAVRSVLTTKE